MVFITVLAILIASCSSALPTPETTHISPTETPLATSTPIPIPDSLRESGAQNVILMIGDGMGATHREAAGWFGLGREGTLVMDQLPIQGMMMTLNLYGTVTDSAAGATALATGKKTSNQRIGMNPNGEPLPTILEQAQERGMAVGLVTTTEISHATPAAFAAHLQNRWSLSEIAEQLIAAKVDVLFGGGERYFTTESDVGCTPGDGVRNDGRNLIQEAINGGYVFACTAEDLAEFVATDQKILGIFADEGMERPFLPSLAEMTRSAIERLSRDPEGFFLMIEGGQIDWASHGWDAGNAMGDTIGFDDAVQVAREFAQADGRTLLIVTADHETGGMRLEALPEGLTGGRSEFQTPDGEAFKIRWSTSSHTDSPVPISAMGPGSELLSGTIDNTFVYYVMRLSLWMDRPPG